MKREKNKHNKQNEASSRNDSIFTDFLLKPFLCLSSKIIAVELV